MLGLSLLVPQQSKHLSQVIRLSLALGHTIAFGNDALAFGISAWGKHRKYLYPIDSASFALAMLSQDAIR